LVRLDPRVRGEALPLETLDRLALALAQAREGGGRNARSS